MTVHPRNDRSVTELVVDFRDLRVEMRERRFQRLSVSLVRRRLQIIRDPRAIEQQTVFPAFELHVPVVRRRFCILRGPPIFDLRFDAFAFPSSGHDSNIGSQRRSGQYVFFRRARQGAAF